MEDAEAGWVDVSVALSEALVAWPGDPPFRREVVESLEAGDEATVSRLSMSSHTGTHVDAPAHFVAGGVTVDAAPLGALIGPARVIAVEDRDVVDVEALEGAGVGAGERVLLRTRNSLRDWAREPFRADYVHLTTEAAVWLAERGTRCVGVDYLSVSGPGDDVSATHLALLEAGVWIIEGLDLSGVEAGPYDLVCLPLKVAGGDGAPARVVIRPRGGAGGGG